MRSVVGHVDGGVVFIEDAFRNEKPEACPLAYSFGGRRGPQKFAAILRHHPSARISDAKHHRKWILLEKFTHAQEGLG